MRSQYETLTRDDAMLVLANHNHANRPKSAARIRRYAREMAEGRWLADNPHGISYDTNGDLQNGQHTLEAFLASGLETLTIYVHRTRT